MSFISDAVEDVGDFVGGVWDDVSGASAADAFREEGQRQEEIAMMQAEPMRRYLDLIQPTIEAGQRQIPILEGAATAQGYGQNVGEILSSGALDPMIQMRQRAADQALASSGLRRSGARVQAAADIPADLAMQIEAELNRRRQSIAGQGQTGISQAGSITGQIGNIIAGGQTAASANRLNAVGAQSAGTSNLLNIGGKILGAF